jgi:hypothetical protein
MDDLIQSESLVRPGVRRRTRTREHIIGHTDIGNQILENISTMESEDLVMDGVCQENGIIIGNGFHIDHINVTLGPGHPNTATPSLENQSGQPPLSLVHIEERLQLIDEVRGIRHTNECAPRKHCFANRFELTHPFRKR